MTAALAAVLLAALTRAEIIERMRAPVITQADGLVQVFADCPDDMRREYQMPIASFAADTVRTLYSGLGRKPARFAKPAIIVHVGYVRTNLTEVTAKAATNDQRVVTRIRVKAPGHADRGRLRLEVIKAFYRAVEGLELGDDAAAAAFAGADPRLRAAAERAKLEDWLAGRGGLADEEGLKYMRRVFEPGRASRRDVLIFASRLFLYPPQHDVKFLGRYDSLSFADAVKTARTNTLARVVALYKANDMPVFGGGKGPELAAAADAYRVFLLEFARGEKSREELEIILDDADVKLNLAYEKAAAR